MTAFVVESAMAAFQSNKELAEKAVAQLPAEKLRVALDANTNSIAVIMKHVGGNLLSRWTDFLTTDGEKPWRNRNGEFVDSFGKPAEIFQHWEAGWDCLFDSLRMLISWTSSPGRVNKNVPNRRQSILNGVMA